MEYLGRTPSPPLDRFIERIWYCSDTSPRPRERVLPSGGAVGLAINLFEEEARVYDPALPGSVQTHSGAIVAGARTRSVLLDWPHRASIVGVQFRPGGALPFIGISPAELVDDHAQLDDLWGCDGRNLREQLALARSTAERFRLVEVALLRRLQRARAGHPAARAAIQAFRSGGNRSSVGEVATMVGLSRRRFIQVFETEVGLTPKLYARLQRFHCVKQRIATLGGPPSWATFAIECGYFDQSHMIRDFVEFSSMTPTSYLQSRTGETRFDQFIHAYRQE